MANVRAGRSEDGKAKKSTPAGTTYFLGIGIDQYQAWPRLRNAVRDVKAIAELLIRDYGIKAEHCFTLYDEQATRATIIQALEDMANRIGNTDSLLVYYAGHGHLNERQRGYWVPADAPHDGISYYISNSTIRDYLGDIASLHTLLISDACFSGSLFVRGERSADLAAHELAKLSSRWAICSGRHDEVVADGPPDGHSPFAESILDVLRQTERPVITTNFLFEQVRDQTRANYDQLPDGGPIQGVGHKRGQFIFERQITEAQAWAEAGSAKTAEAYQQYLSLFPTGKNATTAKNELSTIEGNEAWSLISAASTDRLAEVEQVIQHIRHFCRQYPQHAQFEQAVQLGQQLEHKLNFLQVYDSEFGLMELVRKNTPYKAEAQVRLLELQAHNTPAAPKVEPPEDNTTLPKVEEKTVQDRSNKNSSEAPNSGCIGFLTSLFIGFLAGGMRSLFRIFTILVLIVAVAWSVNRYVKNNQYHTSIKNKAAQIAKEISYAIQQQDSTKVKRLAKEYAALPNDLTSNLPLKEADTWLVNYRDSLRRVEASKPLPLEGKAIKKHLVIANYFKQKADAERQVIELRKMGYDQAQLTRLPVISRFIVIVAQFDNRTSAERLVNELAEIAVESEVKTLSGN